MKHQALRRNQTPYRNRQNRTLCIWLPNWPVQRILVEQPELKSHCVVLHARDPRRGPSVVAANRNARRHRIAVGMPLAEARSLARHASVNATQRARVWDWLEHEPEQDLKQLKQLAADCDRFSPQVGYVHSHERSGSAGKSSKLKGNSKKNLPGSDCLWLDASSHHRLSDSVAAAREKQLQQDVIAMLSHRGHYLCTALAGTFAAAWALAHFGQSSSTHTDSAHTGPIDSQKYRLPNNSTNPLAGPSFFVLSNQTLDALRPLPIEALRLAANTVETLQSLGIETIDQLWDLPRRELPARFGDSLLERMDQATGELAETLEAYRTTTPLSVQQQLDRPTHRQDLLIECLRGLVDQLVDLMKEQNRAALRIDCGLTLDKAPAAGGRERVYDSNAPAADDSILRLYIATTHSLTVGLFEPTCDAERLLHLLSMQLERQVIPRPICTLELTVTVNVRPDQARVQWLPGMEDAAGESAIRTSMKREMSGLVEHLSCRLGDQSVLASRLTAEPQVESAFQLLQLTGGGSINRSKSKRSTTTSSEAALRRHTSTAKTRPIEVFQPPVRLHLQRQATARQSWEWIPTTFSFQGHTYQILQHWGPERIETNWWSGKLTRRDYYRLEDQQGHHWWAFYDLKEKDWFLQGAF